MTGAEFLQTFARKSLGQWEQGVLDLARQGGLTPWPWVELTLTDAKHTAVLRIASDMLSVGPVGQHLRMPLTPTTAQNILNLGGWLLPTPWLVFQIWRAAAAKLDPTPLPNGGANLTQYAQHSAIIDAQLAALNVLPTAGLVAGSKKHVVVSNLLKPKAVDIFGWYRPAPDVWTDGKAWDDPTRQPIQANSNAHGDFYVDYSHGIQAVHGMCTVDGAEMPTEALYQHPELAHLVSTDGALRQVRYPASVPVAGPSSADDAVAILPGVQVPTVPSAANLGASEVWRKTT